MNLKLKKKFFFDNANKLIEKKYRTLKQNFSISCSLLYFFNLKDLKM